MRTHVWLLSAGCPAGPQAVDALRRWLLDPVVLPLRFGWLRVLVAWWAVWRQGPRQITDCQRAGGAEAALARAQEQAALLQRVLGGRYVVHPVLREGGPNAEEAASAVASGEQVVLVPLGAQGGVGVEASLRRARAALGGKKVALVEVGVYADDEGLAEALAETLREALMRLPKGATYDVLFCAAGQAARPGDPYPAQVAVTARAVAQAARLRGPPRVAFLDPLGPLAGVGPRAEEQVAGRGALVVVPVGASAEDIDTLCAIDGALRQAALAAGRPIVERAPALGARPTYLRALAERVRGAERLAGWRVPEDEVRAALRAGATA